MYIRGLCEALIRASLPHYYAAERALVVEVLRRIDEQYRKRKRDASSLDFDDLEEFAIHLLESNADLRRDIVRAEDSIKIVDQDSRRRVAEVQEGVLTLGIR